MEIISESLHTSYKIPIFASVVRFCISDTKFDWLESHLLSPYNKESDAQRHRVMSNIKSIHLGKYMSSDRYKKVIADLPTTFNVDQFTISFLRYFPEQHKGLLWDYSCNQIMKYLGNHILGKTIEHKLHLAKRLPTYPNGKVYWTKDTTKPPFIIRLTKGFCEL